MVPGESLPELTVDELRNVIRKARIEKLNQLHQIIPVPRNYPEFLDAVVRKGELILSRENRSFQLDLFNQEVYQRLAAFFSGDQSYIRHQLNPSKGILLFGQVGTGKTMLMRLMGMNPTNPFKVVDSIEIARQYTAQGEETISKYTALLPVTRREYYGHDYVGLCIDDIGIESTAKHYGQSKEVIEEILYLRYSRRLLKETHLITNLNSQQLRELYGIRLYDRMKEMFNLIEFPQDARSRR